VLVPTRFGPYNISKEHRWKTLIKVQQFVSVRQPISFSMYIKRLNIFGR